MNLPKGMTEEEFIATFDIVIKKLARKFVFGNREENDIYQEAFIIAMQGLEKFDGERPLANFLYIHIRNRLCNYKRKHYMRKEPPCTRCPFKAFIKPDKCSLYNDRMDCDLYERWHKRNIVKRNLTNTLEYGQVVDKENTENNMKYGVDFGGGIDKKEILDLLNKELPARFRKHYTMLINGIKIQKKDEEVLKLEIIKILQENGYDL